MYISNRLVDIKGFDTREKFHSGMVRLSVLVFLVVHPQLYRTMHLDALFALFRYDAWTTAIDTISLTSITLVM